MKEGGGGEVGETGEKASLTGVLNALTDVLGEEVGSEREATRRERKVRAMMGGAGRSRAEQGGAAVGCKQRASDGGGGRERQTDRDECEVNTNKPSPVLTL